MLRMYDVDGKLLNRIKTMYINCPACVRVKGGESELFRVDSGERQGYIIFPWLFSLYMDAVMNEVKMVRMRKIRDYLSSFMQLTWFS